MMKRFQRWATAVLVLSVVASCSSNGEGEGGTFVSPESADEVSSGLTIGFIPEGFTWVWNEGHETATFHTFQTQDGSEQLSVGIQISPPTHPGSGEVVTRGGREFIIYDEGNQARITEDVGNDVRVDVVSDSLDTDTLMRIAESVTYDPERAG